MRTSQRPPKAMREAVNEMVDGHSALTYRNLSDLYAQWFRNHGYWTNEFPKPPCSLSETTIGKHCTDPACCPNPFDQ